MTTYVHGRPERPARRRPRALIVLLLLAAAVGVALRLADPSGASEPLVPVAASDAPPETGDPVLAGLDDELAARFAHAQRVAAADGVRLTLTSGKRSAAEQQELVEAAVERYGSEREAHRWVLPPGSSAHVKGLAVDVGPTSGALWLGEHGLELGLCRTYANELWHFEKLPDGATACAPMHPDSSSGW
ncbi:M15 family metallopeptidase [Cellulomonas edaphi]|uniref:M15 family metallopeptidase n=1 Tax=Cellulomonas edaphi TaxID=3053468 RepID=A0ABT7S3U4_9CELL|nr:M15 family metallopeptidase [Cellulomons edaphi]MDM7830285.1 M15 family metallopeptidase [Cellulomons edaphi]